MKKWLLFVVMSVGVAVSAYPETPANPSGRIELFADAGGIMLIQRGAFSGLPPFFLDLGLQYSLNGNIALEALFLFHPEGSLTIWPRWGGSVNGVFKRELQPKLAAFAKGGVSVTVCDDSDGSYVTYCGFDLGLGLEYHLGRRWGLRAGGTYEFQVVAPFHSGNASWIAWYGGLFWRL